MFFLCKVKSTVKDGPYSKFCWLYYLINNNEVLDEHFSDISCLAVYLLDDIFFSIFL